MVERTFLGVVFDGGSHGDLRFASFCRLHTLIYHCSHPASQSKGGTPVGSKAFLAQTEPVAAFLEEVGTADEVEEAGPERCARGFPLHGIDHGDELACANGPHAFIFVPSVSTHQLRRCSRATKQVHLAGSMNVVYRRLYIKPLLCKCDRHV